MRADRAFTVRFISTFTPDRLYRVYACGDQLAFVKIGGQAGVAEGVAAQFGLLGALVLAWWKKRNRNKVQQTLAQQDQQDVELLLTRDPKNFSIQPGQIARASIDPPAILGAHGRSHGSWKVEETNGTKRSFQFEELAEMREAMQVLPRILGAALTINVKWDEGKKRYTKAEAADKAA
ncbi:MAG TPA: hypothetical protein VGR67_09825 [Candidatus Polarisedimenticolia bacterium]|nr:hypothetical protein [Candidatus Polarisedimenticolia bacterium]